MNAADDIDEVGQRELDRGVAFDQNRYKKRDPEMYHSKKGENCFVGRKAHIGVDSKSGLADTLVTTAGNVFDVAQTHKMLHGNETMVLGDAGSQGADKQPGNADKTLPGTSR